MNELNCGECSQESELKLTCFSNFVGSKRSKTHPIKDGKSVSIAKIKIATCEYHMQTTYHLRGRYCTVSLLSVHQLSFQI